MSDASVVTPTHQKSEVAGALDAGISGSLDARPVKSFGRSCCPAVGSTRESSRGVLRAQVTSRGCRGGRRWRADGGAGRVRRSMTGEANAGPGAAGQSSRAKETLGTGGAAPPAEERYFRAHALIGAELMPIVPAPRARPLFSGQFGRAAKRCLPLMVANQHGWLVLNAATFTVVWDGSVPRGAGLDIQWHGAPPWPRPVDDSFGNGTVSFKIPYLFRTPPGWNLLTRGPANYVKDGVAPLEGLIESDWAVSTFTMNWKLTRPDHPVTFEKGEPICMLVPQRRNELARFVPTLHPAEDDAESYAQLKDWGKKRSQQLIRNFLNAHGKEAIDLEQPEELLYLRGLYPDGGKAREHEVQIRLRAFIPAGRPTDDLEPPAEL